MRLQTSGSQVTQELQTTTDKVTDKLLTTKHCSTTSYKKKILNLGV